MILVLIEIVMLDVKNYWVDKAEAEFGGYSYLVAFGLPTSIIIFIASDLIYEKYLDKLQQSHVGIYQKFLGLLVFLTIAAISAIIIFSLYISKPKSTEWLGLLTMVPYYLCWLVITGFYVYISPGLLDARNNIPFHQVIMLAIYLLYACIYPIYLVMVISSEEKDGKGKSQTLKV
jgi:hypothetical protein